MNAKQKGLCYRPKIQKDGRVSHVVFWKYKDTDGRWAQGQRGIGYAPTPAMMKVIALSRLPLPNRRRLIAKTPWLKKGGYHADDESFFAALLLRLDELKKQYRKYGVPEQRAPKWKRPVYQGKRDGDAEGDSFNAALRRIKGLARVFADARATMSPDAWDKAREEFIYTTRPIADLAAEVARFYCGPEIPPSPQPRPQRRSRLKADCNYFAHLTLKCCAVPPDIRRLQEIQPLSRWPQSILGRFLVALQPAMEFIRRIEQAEDLPR